MIRKGIVMKIFNFFIKQVLTISTLIMFCGVSIAVQAPSKCVAQCRHDREENIKAAGNKAMKSGKLPKGTKNLLTAMAQSRDPQIKGAISNFNRINKACTDKCNKK